MKYEENAWYGWNGGDCPVHPETVVEVVVSDCSFIDRSDGMASVWDWDADEGKIIAFRVIKEHKEPREFWLLDGDVYESEMKAREGKEFWGLDDCEIFHVKEVLE